MLRYLLRRLLGLMLVLFGTSVIVFASLHVSGGDPARVLLGPRAGVTEEALNQIRDKYGLREPLPVQYAVWLGNVLQGDLGESIRARDSVASVIGARLGTTVALTGCSAFLILTIGIPLGIISAVRRGRRTDTVASVLALVASSVPSYVTAVILVAIFAVGLRMFPSLGLGNGSLPDYLYHLTLPAIALAFASIAFVSRVTRASLIEALGREFVQTARSRGFTERRVILKHALRAGLAPILTVGGLMIGYLLAGAVVVEHAFGLNGVGALLVASVQGFDYPVVQAIVLLLTTAFVVANLVVDLLYVVVDPRVRLEMKT